jgi:hypothetical protein
MVTEVRIYDPKMVETDAIVHILKRFREDVESDGETKLHQVVVSCALFLSDICNAFGLSQDQHVEEWQNSHAIPTDMAAIPIEELAATAG